MSEGGSTREYFSISGPEFYGPAPPHYFSIAGVRGRYNGVLVLVSPKPCCNVLYFPGDIQTLEKVMENSDPQWIEYSLERTETLLFERYNRTANIIIIQPARFTLSHLSEYDHLLFPGEGAPHLLSLYKAVSEQMKLIGHASTITDLPIVLIGFSRGVLVLNHLLAEIASLHLANGCPTAPLVDWECPKQSAFLPPYETRQRIGRSRAKTTLLVEYKTQLEEFFRHLQAIHWLDGYRFPTEEKVVRAFAEWMATVKSDPLKIVLHGTPRQLQHPKRKWIRTEMEIFVLSLAAYRGTALQPIVLSYFSDGGLSMENHFKVIRVFQIDPFSDSAPPCKDRAPPVDSEEAENTSLC